MMPNSQQFRATNVQNARAACLHALNNKQQTIWRCTAKQTNGLHIEDSFILTSFNPSRSRHMLVMLRLRSLVAL